jgi:hypothetical protein
MSVAWMLGAMAAGALLGIAGLAAERIAAWFRLPRRWIWAAAMAGSVVLPMAGLLAPGVLPHLRFPRLAAHLPAAAAPNPAAEPDGPAALAARDAAKSGSPAPSPLLLGLAWAAASLATAGVLAWGRGRRRGAGGARAAAEVEGTPVLVSDRAGPMVLGLRRPRIVLPRWAAEGDPGELRLIVAHEREHVRAGDPWLIAIAAAAVAAMPWSPALWWQHRRLRLAVEQDCDARVLARGASRREYGRVLLRTAAHPFLLPASTLAWAGTPSHLERRIMAMTESRPRHPVLRALPLAAFAGSVALAACTLASGGRDAATAVDTRVRHETWNGREVTTRENADGTTSVTVGPDLATAGTTGSTGFSYSYQDVIEYRPGAPAWPKKKHAQVVSIAPGSPAEAAGLMVGDVILTANGVDTRTARLMPDRTPGARYAFHIRRGAEEMDLNLVLGPPAPAR